MNVVPSRRGVLVWAAILIPVWIVMVLCTNWEPVVHDGWGHMTWHHQNTATLANLWALARSAYLHNNPRLGQTVALLMYTPGPWHSMFTPLLELSLFGLLTTLVLGRWPSLRSSDDAFLFATVLVLVCATAGMIGAMLFYRPYTGNYLFGLVVEIALLVPYRFHLEAPRPERAWQAPLLFVVGIAAGMCNEQTGPGLLLLTAGAGVWFARRDGRRPPIWTIAGAVGLLIGGLLLSFAPGQSIRYNAILTQQSMLDRILSRRAYDTAHIFVLPLAMMCLSLPWVALAAIAVRKNRGWTPLPRTRKHAAIAGVGTAGVIVATLLASPKQGLRLDFASLALTSAMLAGAIVAQLTARWARIAGWVLTGAVLIGAGVRFVTEYHGLHEEFEARYAAITHAPPGSTVTVPAYSYGRTWCFIGEDFSSALIRASVAQDYHLRSIELDDRRGTPGGAEAP